MEIQAYGTDIISRYQNFQLTPRIIEVLDQQIPLLLVKGGVQRFCVYKGSAENFLHVPRINRD
jgi:hypothetical protein